MNNNEQSKLSKRKLNVIDDIFESSLSETEALKKHNVSSSLFKKWLAEKAFAGELNFRIDSARRQGEILIAKFAPVAAAKLIELTQSEKEETARKACLDIIALPKENKTHPKQAKTTNSKKPEPLPLKLAAKLLNTLAENME